MLACPGTLTACSNADENAKIECSRTFYGASQGPCTMTFDPKTATGGASVLGRDIDLLKTETDRVTLKAAGTEITVVMHDTETQEANLNINIESISESRVVVRFSEVAV